MLSILETRSFTRTFKAFQKKYRNIGKDFDVFKIAVSLNPRSIGKEIPGYDGEVIKYRMPGSDMKRGKSGGFRIIGLLIEGDTELILLTIYAKSSKENISQKQIQDLLTSALENL